MDEWRREGCFLLEEQKKKKKEKEKKEGEELAEKE